MEYSTTAKALLELLSRPAFCVKDGKIVDANEFALQRFIEIGDPIEKYLEEGLDAYRAFTGGCLFVNVTILELPYGATVTKLQDYDLFLLEKLSDNARQALALAAKQLRQPLNMMFTIGEGLKQQARAEILQSVNQLHRLICNMADLNRYDTRTALFLRPTELTELFSETVKKAAAALRVTKIKLHYTALPEFVIGMADPDMLERAILNIISNAVKFSNQGDTIEATLTRRDDQLIFSVQDNGEGIPPEVLQTAFFRYMREPCIEDGRHGLGLGLALVSSIASCHSGTVLITQPEKGGTRVTMTITITPCDGTLLHSPVQLPTSDYASGQDHALLEFSEILPVRSFKPKSEN